MDKITFKIPGHEGEYHIPLINFEQQDRLIDISPRFIDLISGEKFNYEKPGDLMTAFLQLVTTGSMFSKLAAALICPADRDYYCEVGASELPEGDYEANLKFVKRIPVTHLIEGFVDEKGKSAVKPGVLARSFLASNSNWFAPLGDLLSLWQSEPEQPAESEPSQDTETPDGDNPTG